MLGPPRLASASQDWTYRLTRRPQASDAEWLDVLAQAMAVIAMTGRSPTAAIGMAGPATDANRATGYRAAAASRSSKLPFEFMLEWPR